MADNNYVVQSFRLGKRAQENNLISIPLADDRMALLSYGWAVIATRDSDGHITAFTGWSGYSKTTSHHVNLVEEVAHDTSDTRPETGDVLRLERVREADGV